MENTIDIEKHIIQLSTTTIVKLFEYKNGADLVALYLFYHKQSKLQKTNQSFTLKEFAKKGLGWGDKRFKDAKRILKSLDLIEDIADRDEKGIIKGWYIRLKYIQSLNKATLSSGAETHPVDRTTSGCQKTNALSNKLEMLKVNNINAGDESLVFETKTNYELLVDSKRYNELLENELLVNEQIVDSKKTNIVKSDKNKVNGKNNDEAKKFLESQFEGFWKLYPRKVGKATAKKSFMKQIKNTDDLWLLKFGLEEFIKFNKKEGTELKFYPHCSTWLNQERFRDYEDKFINKTIKIETKPVSLEDKDNVDWL